MLEDSAFNRYLAEDGGGLEQYFTDRYAAQCATSGMDFYWHIRNKVMLNRGERSIPYSNLEGGKTYHPIACAVDQYGQIVSIFGTASFKTQDVTQSDMTFRISVDEITSGGATFSVIPSTDEEPYLPVAFAAASVAGMSDDQVVSLAREEMGLSFDYSMVRGEQHVVNTDFSPASTIRS